MKHILETPPSPDISNEAFGSLACITRGSAPTHRILISTGYKCCHGRACVFQERGDDSIVYCTYDDDSST